MTSVKLDALKAQASLAGPLPKVSVPGKASAAHNSLTKQRPRCPSCSFASHTIVLLASVISLPTPTDALRNNRPLDYTNPVIGILMGACSITSGIEQSQDIDQQTNSNLRLGLLVGSAVTALAFTILHCLKLGGWNTATSFVLKTIFWSILLWIDECGGW